ncbi:MAG: hypothetical protein Q9214_002709 [Letrouitia sp. 1 TL-2023]
MNVSNLLSYDAPSQSRYQHDPGPLPCDQQRAHQYPTRHSVLNNNHPEMDHRYPAAPRNPDFHDDEGGSTSYDPGQASHLPKNVAFELLFDGPNTRARLPMRVQIFPHDTTDSIVTTVKNFYGLYDGAATGVSFEDERGNTLIARYENFKNNMVVYVRVISDYSHSSFQYGQMPWNSASPISPARVPHLEDAFQMPPPNNAQHLNYEQPISRPASRMARKRSASPNNGKSRRSGSTQKGWPRSGLKSRDASVPSNIDELNSDAINGYSDSDGGAGSVSSSRKARSEQLASAEISVDNIVEGGRRKRAKFESSELPLFVPPQVPAANSISSISPQRRSNGQDNPSPFAKPLQRTFSHTQPLQSPQSHGFSDYSYGLPAPNNQSNQLPAAAGHGHLLRDRPNTSRLSTRSSSGFLPRQQAMGVLPTPDPTIASCISDEDVALQLMRLGDASNISHGRTSASTLDDALSGRADIASSASDESGNESENNEQQSFPSSKVQLKVETTLKQPAGISQRLYTAEHSGDEADEDYRYDEKRDGPFKSETDALPSDFTIGKIAGTTGSKGGRSGAPKPRSSNILKTINKPTKLRASNHVKKAKASSTSNTPNILPSPTSAPQSRKTSSASALNFQHHLGADEEDLSSKPRCQRCRKSKKGCDRQRPCQRCKDAGIGPDGCISEDEGNGRKGRFGRHMGVSVKKDVQNLTGTTESEAASAILADMAAGSDKSKKRKR